jgi:Protein of unknown function (DUF1194)
MRLARLGPVFGALALAFSFATLAASSAQTRATIPVDLELVLAVDVSASMDEEEQMIQRRGYAEAFRHPAVISAIKNSGEGRIAVTYLEWAEQVNQTVPWMVIANDRDARAFAAKLEAAPLYSQRRTSISNALATGGALIEQNQYQGVRRVIDISGDGPNNSGATVNVARDAVVGRGVVINGLPILLNKPTTWYDIADLDKYYKDCVIGGRGAFVLPVRSIGELAGTIRSKLVTEIADLGPRESGFMLARAAAPVAKADCTIGEKNWGMRRFDDRGLRPRR